MKKNEMAGYTHKKMSRQLALIVILMLAGMTVYESLKQLVFPDITIWQSHAITIIFSTLSATTASFFVLKTHIRLSKAIIKKKMRAMSCVWNLKPLSRILKTQSIR